MNSVIRQLLAFRRERAAAEGTSTPAPYDEQPGTATSALRRGVVKIVSNDDGGQYTVTEQWWNASTLSWQDAIGPVGHVQASARDYQQRDTAQIGAVVPFWEQRARGGQLELLIDVGAEQVCWGKATADWTSGNVVNLDPCNASGDDNGLPDVTAYLVCPTAESGPGEGLEPDISQGDVLAYLPFGQNQGVVVSPVWRIDPDCIGDLTAIHKALDKWVRVTQATGGTAISQEDWRGRVLWVSMSCYDGSVAQSLQDKWSALGQTTNVIAAMAGATFDEDDDELNLTLLSVMTNNYTIDLYMQEDTGHLYLAACGEGETQVRVVVRATKAKTSADQTI